MTAPAHYAIGAASVLFIQKYLPSESSNETKVVWALVIAIASHVVADAIPHDEHFLKGWQLALELAVETIVMLAVLVGASESSFMATIILAGMLGAVIPDGLGILNRCVEWPVLLWADNKIHTFHGKLNLFYANYFLQLVIIVMCSAYVRIKSIE